MSARSVERPLIESYRTMSVSLKNSNTDATKQTGNWTEKVIRKPLARKTSPVDFVFYSLVNISIIIPALNEADQIFQSIERARSTRPHEVIVIDGGSEDETASIAENCDCRVLQSLPGRAVQQNLGASQATGDVLLFLHADCWLAKDALEQIETALAEIQVVGGAFYQHIAADGLVYRLLEAGNALRVRFLKIPFGDQGIFVRRSTFDELGGFPNVRLMEDVLLMRKLRRRSRLVLLRGPLNVSARRWQRHGVIRQTARNWSLLMAQWIGVSPNRLADFYSNVRSPKSGVNQIEAENDGFSDS